MGILTRFVRMCKADMHGVMDQMEDKSLILKQHLRDMESELEDNRIELEQLKNDCDNFKKEHERYENEINALEKDVEIAISGQKDDIAKFLIKKLKSISGFKDELSLHIKDMNGKITDTQACFETRQRQFEELKIKSRVYFHNIAGRERENDKNCTQFDKTFISDEEVEIELLRRRENMKGERKDE